MLWVSLGGSPQGIQTESLTHYVCSCIFRDETTHALHHPSYRTMAPIFTARGIQPKESTSPLFKLNGAVNLFPDRLSNLGLVAMPQENAIAYDAYRANIDAFVAATASGHRVFVGADGYPFTPRGILPIPSPPVSWTPKKETSRDVLEKMKNSFAPGSSVEKSGKTFVLNIPTCDDDDLKFIMSIYNPNHSSGPDYVTPPGLAAFKFLTGFLHEFLATHTYPSFSQDPREEGRMVLSAALSKPSLPSARFIIENKDKPIGDDTYSARVARQEEGREVEGMQVDESGVGSVETYYKELSGRIDLSLHDAVLTAKPSPGRAENNVGSISAIPELPGIVFPYFEGLVNADPNTFKDFVFAHCMRLLGADRKSVQDTYISLRRGFNSLSTTPAGKALSHILVCARLALQGQARLYVIVENKKYFGCVLLGSGFDVCTGGHKWVSAYSREQLRRDLSFLDPHLAAVEGLRSGLERMKIADKYTGSVTFTTVDNPSELDSLLRGLTLKDADDDVVGEISSAISRLNFRGNGYRSVSNPADLIWFLKTFFSSDIVELTIPCYIPSVKQDRSDRLFILLSAFGPDAPSLWNEKGKEFLCQSLDKEIVVDGKRKRTGDLDIFGNMPEALLVTPKPILVALKDWQKFILVKKAIKIDLTERAGKNRNKGIVDDDTRKAIWTLLVDGMKGIGGPTAKKARVESEEVNQDDAIAEFLSRKK